MRIDLPFACMRAALGSNANVTSRTLRRRLFARAAFPPDVVTPPIYLPEGRLAEPARSDGGRVPGLAVDVAENIVLASPSAQAIAGLDGELEWDQLEKGAVLVEPGAPVEAFYLPLSGLGSVGAISPEGAPCRDRHGRNVKAWPASARSRDREYAAPRADPGWRRRLPAGCAARSRADPGRRHAAWRAAVLAQAFSVQTAHMALSKARHTIEERLARWLLTSHDRMDGDVVPLMTSLALMLGVRRPSVTTALHAPAGMHLIRATRAASAPFEIAPAWRTLRRTPTAPPKPKMSD